MVSDCKRMVEEEGYGAVKLKVGGADPREDLRRVEAVRRALGPEIRITTDANGRWNLPQAIQAANRLADFDITWIEEPLNFDAVDGHRRLADAIQTPIALGEQLYTRMQFRDFIHAGAVHYVQPDVVRVAGITEFWQIADLAHCYSLPVAPHVGDMCQVHQHLCFVHPACSARIHTLAARLDCGAGKDRSGPICCPHGSGRGYHTHSEGASGDQQNLILPNLIVESQGVLVGSLNRRSSLLVRTIDGMLLASTVPNSRMESCQADRISSSIASNPSSLDQLVDQQNTGALAFEGSISGFEIYDSTEPAAF